MTKCRYQQAGLPSHICPECGKQHLLELPSSRSIFGKHKLPVMLTINCIAVMIPILSFFLIKNDGVSLGFIIFWCIIAAIPASISIMLFLTKFSYYERSLEYTTCAIVVVVIIFAFGYFLEWYVS